MVYKSTEVLTLQLRVYKIFSCLESFTGVVVPSYSAFGLQDISGGLESSAKKEVDTILGAIVVTSHVRRFIDDQNWKFSDLEIL